MVTDVKTGGARAPIVAVTMGDAAGIGPEVVVKALAAPHTARPRTVVIGDLARLALAADICALDVRFRAVTAPEDCSATAGVVDVIDVGLIPRDLPFGTLSTAAGEAAYRYVALASEYGLDGRIDAICTAPLNKEALNKAGHHYPGHTELLADLMGVREVSMMLTTDTLNVIHVTTHIGLVDAVARIEPGLVLRTIVRGHTVLSAAAGRPPRIAVCGINPHAGENGLFGHGEEEDKLLPAMIGARAAGIDVQGPLPADTVFYRAVRGEFDLVVAMYHDQGHIPVKVLGLESGVNVTVGLPVVRTSVDHGTAFDIAGTGTADERSMLIALEQAVRLAGVAHTVGSAAQRTSGGLASR